MSLADQERIVKLLRAHGDPSEVAALLGVSLDTVHAVMRGDTGTSLPSGGGGGGVSVGVLTDEALPNMGDWTAQADPTRPSLLNVQADVTLAQGEVAVGLTLNVRPSSGGASTTPSQFSVSRNGAEAAASAGDQTYMVTLTALLAPGDEWTLTGPAGHSEIDAVNERSL